MAEAADERKSQKYHALLGTHSFVPLALETLGPINKKGLDFIAELGRHVSSATGEPREANFLTPENLHYRPTVRRGRFQRLKGNKNKQPDMNWTRDK